MRTIFDEEFPKFDQNPLGFWFLIRNDPKLGQGPTLEAWCLYQTCPTGTSNWDTHNLLSETSRLGQVVLVPVGQAGCLYQTCPTGTRKGEKKPLLVPWDKSYPHAGGLSLSQDKLYTHDGACPSSTCPNLSQLVPQSGSTRPWNIYTYSTKYAGAILFFIINIQLYTCL